jgi:hypothetical protein
MQAEPMDIAISLEALAKRELIVMDTAHGLAGTMEAKFARLREIGTFRESAVIHKAYVDLASLPSVSLEALKRAVFLGWYQTSEPGCFTGVGDLDGAHIRRAQVLLQAAHAAGQVDAEFRVMLGWYWLTADYHFQYYSSLPVIKYLSGLDPQAYKRHGFVSADLESRGQMGKYWISIACRAA